MQKKNREQNQPEKSESEYTQTELRYRCLHYFHKKLYAESVLPRI